MKRKDQPVKPGQVPPSVRATRTYQRPKVSKRSLPSYTEAMLLLHAPEVLRQYWAGLLKGIAEGEKFAFEQVGEIFNYVKGKGMTVSVVQQMYQQNAAAGESAPVLGYDALIRKLNENRIAPAPKLIEQVAETPALPAGE